MAATPNKRKAARKPAKGKAPETKADKLKKLIIEKGGINKEVMAAEPNEFALGLAPTTQTGNFTLLFSQHQKIMSRLL